MKFSTQSYAPLEEALGAYKSWKRNKLEAAAPGHTEVKHPAPGHNVGVCRKQLLPVMTGPQPCSAGTPMARHDLLDCQTGLSIQSHIQLADQKLPRSDAWPYLSQQILFQPGERAGGRGKQHLHHFNN